MNGMRPEDLFKLSTAGVRGGSGWALATEAMAMRAEAVVAETVAAGALAADTVAAEAVALR